MVVWLKVVMDYQNEEHPRYCQAKVSKVEEKLVHLMMLEMKKYCRSSVGTSSSLRNVNKYCLEGLRIVDYSGRVRRGSYSEIHVWDGLRTMKKIMNSGKDELI
ncbi:hypothetical protein Tco_1465448 [Tanacetum coccineum]